MKKNIETSVVIPAFNEANSLVELLDRCARTMNKRFKNNFEILIVDDGSTDETQLILSRLVKKYSFLNGIILRTNFGKSIALMSGFSRAKGKFIVTLDADLQDRPEEIPMLISKLKKGYDLVNGWRFKRKDSWFRKLGSRFFNFVVRRYTGLSLRDENCGFKAYRKQVVENLFVYGQFHRLIPLQIYLRGFKICEIKIKNDARKHGVSKYKAFRYQGAFDLLSLLFTIKHSFTPLHFFGPVSLLFFIPGLLVFSYLVLSHIFAVGFKDYDILVSRPLLDMSFTTMLAGLIILMTGFVCDFILYHHLRFNSRMITENTVVEIIGSKRKK